MPGVLDEFTRRTSIGVDAVYDTEATKSLGLVERLIREADSPRADVFWNNELLARSIWPRGASWRATGTRLGTDARTVPRPRGRWVGFGGRLRVRAVAGNRGAPRG